MMTKGQNQEVKWVEEGSIKPKFEQNFDLITLNYPDLGNDRWEVWYKYPLSQITPSMWE